MSKIVSIREQVASLDDRIADAFEASMTSAALKALVVEVEQASADARAVSEQAAARALDPKVRPAEVSDARRQMEDANFRSNRMDAAAGQLKVLLEQALQREAADEQAAEYTAAKAERDQLVKDLAAYEQHAAAIVALLERVSQSNVRLQKANRGRSADEWLYSAQKIARGASQEFGINPDSSFPDLLQGVKLPRFRADAKHHGYAWPRSAY